MSTLYIYIYICISLLVANIAIIDLVSGTVACRTTMNIDLASDIRGEYIIHIYIYIYIYIYIHIYTSILLPVANIAIIDLVSGTVVCRTDISRYGVKVDLAFSKSTLGNT